MTDLPIVGAAMTLKDVEINRNWVLEKPRDLELQDFAPAEVLAGDWQSVVDEARRLLDGHAGRLGMHGPFMGLNGPRPTPTSAPWWPSVWIRRSMSRPRST